MLYDLLNGGKFIFNGKFHTNHFTIGNFDIYFYAICIVTGMVVCCLLAAPMFKRKGENPDFILDLMIAIVPSCIIGARLWYVIFDIKTFINADNPFLAIINIRDGGLAIYGGLAAGALAIFVVCKIKKVSFLKVLDLAAAVVPFGQMMGRWGNFFNQEVYGQRVTDPKWQFFPAAVEINKPGEWYQALFFYEGCLNFILFVSIYIFLWKSRSKQNGYALSFYLIGYGFIRAVLETFRQSEYNLPLFGKDTKIPAMTIISIVIILGGVAMLLWTMKKDGLIFRKKTTTNSATTENALNVSETADVKVENTKLRPKSLELTVGNTDKSTDENKNEINFAAENDPVTIEKNNPEETHNEKE